MADLLSHPYSLLLDRRSSKAPFPGVPLRIAGREIRFDTAAPRRQI
jgi:hypothetical protein